MASRVGGGRGAGVGDWVKGPVIILLLVLSLLSDFSMRTKFIRQVTVFAHLKLMTNYTEKFTFLCPFSVSLLVLTF